MKVIVDTNILISAAFRGGKPKIAIAHVIDSSSIEWIASYEIIKEYKEVLSRPKLKLSQITRQEWLKLIDLVVIPIDVKLTIDFPRDRKDAKFLACAIFSGANYLITGDKDFENIPVFGTTRVVTVSQFLEICLPCAPDP